MSFASLCLRCHDTRQTCHPCLKGQTYPTRLSKVRQRSQSTRCHQPDQYRQSDVTFMITTEVHPLTGSPNAQVSCQVCPVSCVLSTNSVSCHESKIKPRITDFSVFGLCPSLSGKVTRESNTSATDCATECSDNRVITVDAITSAGLPKTNCSSFLYP